MQSGEPGNPPALTAANALVNLDAKLFTYSFTGTSYPDEETVNIIYDSTEDDFKLTVNGSTQYLNIKGVLGHTPRVLGFAACGAGGRGSSGSCGGGGAGTAIFLINFDIVTQIDMRVGAGYATGDATSTVITIKSNLGQSISEVKTTITCGAGENASSSAAGSGGAVSITSTAPTLADLPVLGIQILATINGTAGTKNTTSSSGITQAFSCFSKNEARSQLSTAGATTKYYGVGGSSLGQGGYAPSSTTARYPYFGGGGRGQNGGNDTSTRRGGTGGFLIWY